MTIRLFSRALLATLLMPGTVAGLIPYLILGGAQGLATNLEFSPWILFALVIGLCGLIMLIHAISGFALHGKGTLAPIDPPRTLVLRGLYNRTRNPMYVGVLCILIAEAMVYQSVSLLGYALVIFVMFHLFIILYEEPHLKEQFGKAYEEYSKRVPRWVVPTRVSSGMGKRLT